MIRKETDWIRNDKKVLNNKRDFQEFRDDDEGDGENLDFEMKR